MPDFFAIALDLINTFKNNAVVVGGDIVSLKITEKQCRACLRWHCFFKDY